MDIQKVLDSADKAKKSKSKNRNCVLVQENTKSVMDMMVDIKIAQLDFFEDAAEHGDKDEF